MESVWLVIAWKDDAWRAIRWTDSELLGMTSSICDEGMPFEDHAVE
jgi:hypothetical protein